MEPKTCEKCGAPLTENDAEYKCDNCGTIYEKSAKMLNYQLKSKRLDEEKRKNLAQERYATEEQERKQDRRENLLAAVVTVILMIISLIVYLVSSVQSLFASIFGQ